MYPVNVIPARGAASLETPTSLKALDGVVRLYDTAPYARSLGTVAKQAQDGSGVPETGILIHQNEAKVIISDDADVKTAMAFAGAANEAVLTPSDIGNSTHEWTASGDALSDLLGADGAALLSELAITARKPKRSVRQVIDDILEAAKLNAAPVQVFADLENGVVKIFKDTGGNLNTQAAAVIAEAPATGLFAVLDGTEAPEGSTPETPTLDI
jgi:hypothetical protein